MSVQYPSKSCPSLVGVGSSSQIRISFSVGIPSTLPPMRCTITHFDNPFFSAPLLRVSSAVLFRSEKLTSVTVTFLCNSPVPFATPVFGVQTQYEMILLFSVTGPVTPPMVVFSVGSMSILPQLRQLVVLL